MSTYAVSLGAGPFIAGLAVGMYSLSNTFGNIISGIFSDRKGPFAILVIGLLSTSTALFSYSLIDGPYSLLVVRFLHGLTAGLIVPAAFTYLANRTKIEKRGRGSALSGAFIGLAAIIGPAYGAIYTSRNSVSETMLLTGILIFIVGFAAFIALRQTTITKEQVAKNTVSLIDILKNKGLFRSFSGAFFLMFSQGVLAYMLPLKVEELGFDSQLSGLLLSTFGVSAILVFLLPVNRIFDMAKPIYTLIAGFAVMSASLFFLSAVLTEPLLYLSMCIYGIGFALLFPSINSILIDSTDTLSRGRSYGYFYAFFSAGVVVGSSITGALALNPDQGFIFSACLLLTAALVNTLTHKK